MSDLLEMRRSPAAMGYAEGATHAIRSPAGRVLGQAFRLDRAAFSQQEIYPPATRARLVEQLIVALRDFYVHLPRKRAIYGHDPVRALELLRGKMSSLSDGEFHETLTGIIARIRDRHVVLYAHAPYGFSATLPFTIERCWIDGAETYVVTKVEDDPAPARLQRGARVTHWNGIPIARFVRLTASLFDGSNDAAALARSLAYLTSRPLIQFGPPLEEWVTLSFVLDGLPREEEFSWSGLDTGATPIHPSLGRSLIGFGGDPQLMELHQSRRARFAASTFDAPPEIAPTPPAGGRVIEGRGAGGVFDYGRVVTDDGEFGYLRFWSFRANEADDLVNALIPILPRLPQNGVIFDIRGNAGGYIAAGERILQLFTDRRITPHRFQFRVTDATRAMAVATDSFVTWRKAFAEAFATGEEYTQGFPIEGGDDDFNRVGRKYPGPVVLITDALAFSTADMFAAGFMDHGLGRVICTDENMAAAGGNNWVPWDIVRLFNPDFNLDSQVRADIEAGQLSDAVRSAFNAAGASLSQQAQLSEAFQQYDGRAWTVEDAALRHVIRDIAWLSPALPVYLARSRHGLADMPAGVTVGVTMRRAIRSAAQEGRVLEDVGITPDIVYPMTLRDVMGQNEDLFVRAGQVLRGG